MDLHVCKTVVCNSVSQIEVVKCPNYIWSHSGQPWYAQVRCWLGTVSTHQAQKSHAVFAQKFKLSFLTEESPGKEGQEHFQMVLMKRRYPGQAGIHSCPYSSSFIYKETEQDQPKELMENKMYFKNISGKKLYEKYMNVMMSEGSKMPCCC